MAAVLIVDDSAADRALLRTILGRAGYTVYEVAKGREALEQGQGSAAARHHPRRQPARHERAGGLPGHPCRQRDRQSSRS